MNTNSINRRGFITQLASGLLVTGLASLSSDAIAAELARTPWTTEGPFYPYGKLPLDKDNDLVIVGNSPKFAQGTITNIAGRILDAKGNPLKNAVIEIWQVDANGIYIAQGENGRDKNFQGYGKFETGVKGEYRFRTIKPVIYPGRTPHIHVKITAPGGKALTTQLFIKGHPNNAGDNVLGSIRDAASRALVVREFAFVKDSKIGECLVNFDIVLGATPQEDGHDNFGGPGGPGGRGRGGRRPPPPPGGFGGGFGGPPPGGFGGPGGPPPPFSEDVDFEK